MDVIRLLPPDSTTIFRPQKKTRDGKPLWKDGLTRHKEYEQQVLAQDAKRFFDTCKRSLESTAWLQSLTPSERESLA